MNAGIRNPRRQVKIALSLFGVCFAAFLYGVVVIGLLGNDSAIAGVALAVGILGSLIFLFMTFNFLWAVRIWSAMQRGENVIARWTVPADVFDQFRENEKGQIAEGHPNDYRLPRQMPPAGVDVIFSKNGVIIGDTYFGLATTGLLHIRQVGIVPGNPLCLGFQTAMISGRRGGFGAAVQVTLGLLRMPVANTAHAEAKTVIDHYSAALSGALIVRPDFWNKRIKWGLWAAGISAVAAAAGFGLNALGVEGEIPLVLAVAGTIFAIGGLVLVLIAWTNKVRERRGRNSDGTPA